MTAKSLRFLASGALLVLLCTLVLSLCAQGPASADEESELTAEQIAGQLAQLREWTQSLESGNLEGLWQAIEASGAPSPQIDSPAFAAAIRGTAGLETGPRPR